MRRSSSPSPPSSTVCIPLPGGSGPGRLWLYFLQEASAYDAFLADVQAATADAAPWREGGRPPWTESVLAAFVRHALATRRCHRLLEKTPSHIDRAEWILDSLPEAQMLFIHRHPVDTYASYRRRAEVDPKATWAALTVDEFAEIFSELIDDPWGRALRRLVGLIGTRHPAALFVVRIEQVFQFAPTSHR